MANYHPDDTLLMQFAAGQLPNALGVMVACHLEKCHTCRQHVRVYETLGGNILTDLPEQTVATDTLHKVLARLDEPGKEQSSAASVVGNISIPRPLRRFVKEDFDKLQWSGMSSNIKEFEIPISDGEYTAKFYKISAGKELPEHTHEGKEFTLVVEGSFSDRTCDYHAGDFILADQQTKHQPRASMDADCICFAVMDAPLKMTGTFGRMLNPFLR